MKKAQIYKMFIFSLIVVIVILPFAFIAANKKRTKFEKNIGETQIHVLKTYEKGEKLQFYIDESAYLSLSEAVYSLGESGFGVTECGKSGTYTLWANEVNTCFPDSSNWKEILKKGFIMKFENYISKYPISLPAIYYYYEISDNFGVTGKTADKIYLEVNTDEKIRIKDHKELSIEEIEEEIAEDFSKSDTPELIGYYTIIPSFKAELEYDFVQMQNSAKELYTIISNPEFLLTGENIQRMFSTDEKYEGWYINSCEEEEDISITGNTVKICVNTGIFHYAYNNNEFEKMPILVKFGFKLASD